MIPLFHALVLVSILFMLGLIGVMVRRNLFFILLGLEIMLNATALAFVVIGEYFKQAEGQVMYILIITLAASKASVCLTFLLRLYRSYQVLDIDKISEIRG
ncbi:NADH-quinone oxidoreductase subunit NuoK [Blochmannia endosymbiont of Colobopsis nipponica]|uniref:NADH-quinone oxidoreductase subunit NuoK n=1 Tax=Blochmannia endosymbiont of Colobopsis nipponica TaxID=2681987 RepID=UPI00178150DF|nr:NADH-quinone oxidoreductase subunit NuoK [Blochmannia endosymbiont of Colobopsis nipponica]QOI10981.1 NADH-quinone oxidoreductase subunit NuoK [Blochmannia endosymbiont of Colobopsis nipponica]